MPYTEAQELQAKIRNDLIRRLFAVAISVGAASTLANMGWVKSGDWPNLSEWKQLSILTVALTATVLSWDGYLISIEQRPLIGFWRFAIDISLVFVYMFLLMTSTHPTWWLTIHAITYALYAVWDFLSVREHLGKYYQSELSQKSVIGVYWGGLWNDVGVSRGPIITLVWGVYFWILVWINYGILSDRIFITSIFAMAGLIIYRQDKRRRYRFLTRALIAALLVLGNALYVKCVKIFTDQYLFNLFLGYT